MASIGDQTVRVPISSIQINRDERQRREFDTSDLESSISKIGLLNPIIITKEFELRAGERRLMACKALGHADILCRFADGLTPLESQIIELEENIKRKDLDWPDLVRAVQRVHELHQELDPEWTQEQTGEVLAIRQGTVAMYTRVARELDDERVQKATTVREAYSVLQRRDQRAAGDALQELLDTPDVLPGSAPLSDSGPAIPGLPGSRIVEQSVTTNGLRQPLSNRDSPHLLTPESILIEDFLSWAPKYRGPKFSFIHCDFPYGIEFAQGPQGLGAETTVYDDSPDVYAALLNSLCHNIDRLMSVSGHLMFWYSAQHHEMTMEIFQKVCPSLVFHKHPLIWLKSDNAGIASDPRQGPRHVYETCLFATRGKRPILKVVADAYSAPTDKKLHPSCKPEPMLRHFMQMIVDEHTTMLDPTCGSGAALRAAESLGARQVLGLELDERNAELARQALTQSRRARKAAEALTT